MSFFAPLMLLGLFAIAIPPILHLLNRREAKPVPFPAMEFLRRAYRKNARRLKMKQWLLLAIRMALFAALALALARPFWDPPASDRDSGVGSTEHLKGVQVIVVDTSYPLAYQVDAAGRSLFDLARSHALRILSDQTAPVGIVIVGEQVNEVTQSVTADHDLLAEAVRKMRVGEHVGDLKEGVNNAYRLLRDRPRSEPKHVILLSTPSRYLTDLPKPPLDLGDVGLIKVDLSAELRQAQSGEDTAPVDTGDGLPTLSAQARAELNNHAILGLNLSPAPHMGEGQWRVEVRVAHYGDQPLTLWPIWVELEGEIKVRGFVSLKPGETGVKRLYFRAHQDRPSSSERDQEQLQPVSALKGWVKLAPDALSIDDERPFWIEPTPPASVLALNGDPRPTPQDDELFYLERALAPEVLGRDRVSLMSRPTSTGEISDQLLEGVDLILIANVPRPSAELGQQLSSHLKSGGGIWLAPGSRVNVDTWNASFRDFLPRPLRGARLAGDAAASVESRGVAHLTTFSERHQLLKPFEDLRRSNLALARFNQYMLFDPEPTPQSEVVMKLDEGLPFLLTRQVGAGRVVMWAGPMDREWSDLVIRPDFIPLAAQTIRYLTREERGALTAVSVGHQLKVELNGEGPFWALSRRGERRLLTRVVREDQTQSRARGWSLDGVKSVGHHRIIAAREGATQASDLGGGEIDGEVVARRFVVNLDTQLSDLRIPETSGRAEDAQGQAGAETTVSALAQRRELWHLGLFGLFLFALLEGVTLFQRRDDQA